MNVHRYLIHGYRYLTMPLRQGLLARLRRRGQVPVGILFYHRVGDQHLNPWTITNERFCEHVKWLEKNFDLVSLEEAQRRIRSGHNQKPTVCITFDDGYSDNCTRALPMLIEKNIPVTYFVTAKNILDETPFPHDLAEDCPLGTNNREMLKLLHRAGIEIAAHTMTHADLATITDPQQLYEEVIGGKLAIEEAVDCQIRYFAFPFGQRENLNPSVFQLCHDHGIQGVCSAFGGWNEIGGDAFHLRRFHGDYRTAYLQNWLTMDPRKRNIPGFEYELDLADDQASTDQPAAQMMPSLSVPTPTTSCQTDGLAQ